MLLSMLAISYATVHDDNKILLYAVERTWSSSAGLPLFSMVSSTYHTN